MSETKEPAFLRVRFYTTLPAVLLLLSVLTYGTAEMIHSQLLALGEHWWTGYHTLRHDPDDPDCDPIELERLRDETLTKKPAIVPDGPRPDTPVPLDDLDFNDDDAAPPPSPAGGEAAPKPVDDLEFDEEPAPDPDKLNLPDDPGAAAAAGAKPPKWHSFEASRLQCIARWAAVKEARERITPSVRRFRAIEQTVEWIVDLGVNHLSHLLALLILICAVATTFFRHHIALRPARSRLDHLASDGAQLAAHLLLLSSFWSFKRIEDTALADHGHGLLHWIWIIGFGLLSLASLFNLLRPPADATGKTSIGRALLSVPLYTTMCLIAGLYFLIAEGHPAGLAIYIGKLTEHALLYLHIGLYVWVGMLLKRTRLSQLIFEVLRPWRLAPELLAFVTVVGAALPTAYSGASGIFVIAAGAIIYRELRRAGARRQLALAATAMSGSMGVVLSPCLLVVIVASLNSEVTTDQLFDWGFKVFLLTAVLFFVVSLVNRQGKWTMASPREALPGTWRAVRALLPYIVLFVVLLVGYSYALDANVDEHRAPVMLPVLMIGVLLYDRLTGREVVGRSGRVRRFGFRKALGAATSETTGHIGALLLLMGMSICVGGIIERADVMSAVPEHFGSIYLTMGVLVFVLVIIGMTMDPYGAVVLVSATIAEVAYRNHIDPVHFWMVVLVAFELGYLTPPVALNHLLTRQVVGDTKVERAEHESGSFWARHERVLLPIAVMGTALLLVAFVPLFVAY